MKKNHHKFTRKLFVPPFILLFLVSFSNFVIAQVIAYSSKASGTYDICVMNEEGSQKTNLSVASHDPLNQFTEQYPKWSPDGRKIAFISDKAGCPNVWIMDSDGQNDFRLTDVFLAELHPRWSPDGSKIYFARNKIYASGSGCAPCPHWEIFVYDFLTDSVTQLTDNSYREMGPVVSPDGNEVAFFRSEGANDCCNQTDLWIMNADGSDQRPLYGYHNGKYEWSTDWGEANNKISFGKQYSGPGRSGWEACSVDPDGTNFVRLTINTHYDVPLSFSADGQKMVYASEATGYFDLYVKNLNDIDGTYKVQLTSDVYDDRYGADWIPNNPPVALCRDIEISADENCELIITPDDIDNGSYDPDNYDTTTISIDHAGPFSLGNHLVTLTVTDSLGVSDSCQAIVTVLDTSPPMPDTEDLPTLIGECIVEITASPTATDNCAGLIEATTADPLVYSELGTYIVTWNFDDRNGNSATQTQTVVVEDTTAPQLSLSVSPNVLWPPNHKMVLITPTTIVSDNCDVNPSVELTSITMNEGDETNTYDPNFDSTAGDGNTNDDIQVNEDGNIYLRAERSGTGTGRVYTITFTATDTAGNWTTVSAAVTVPRNQ